MISLHTCNRIRHNFHDSIVLTITVVTWTSSSAVFLFPLSILDCKCGDFRYSQRAQVHQFRGWHFEAALLGDRLRSSLSLSLSLACLLSLLPSFLSSLYFEYKYPRANCKCGARSLVCPAVQWSDWYASMHDHVDVWNIKSTAFTYRFSCRDTGFNEGL